METRNVMLAALVLLSPFSAPAQEVLQAFSWPELEASGDLLEGRVVDDENPAFLRVEGGSSTDPVTVLRLHEPSITQPMYGFAGEVRYREVGGEGYLELWNHFPGARAYFSRSLSSSGPLQSLRGSSSWRPFLLPFSRGELPAPEKLVFNLVLPEGGSVDLRNLRLVQYEEQGAPAFAYGTGEGWWGPRTGGLIGAVGGVTAGILFPLLGYLVHTGRARRTACAVAMLLHLAGGLSFIVGVVALVGGQPYGVYYPLLLLGFLTAFFSLLLLFRDRRLRGERELRRLQAMDAG